MRCRAHSSTRAARFSPFPPDRPPPPPSPTRALRTRARRNRRPKPNRVVDDSCWVFFFLCFSFLASPITCPRYRGRVRFHDTAPAFFHVCFAGSFLRRFNDSEAPCPLTFNLCRVSEPVKPVRRSIAMPMPAPVCVTRQVRRSRVFQCAHGASLHTARRGLSGPSLE